MRKLIPVFFLLCVTSIFAQSKKVKTHYLSHTKTAAEIRRLENKQERLYYSLLGEFSNKRQADTATNPLLAINQDMIAVPIWQERKGEYWFYMGWFKHGAPDKPLSQGFFKLSKANRDTFLLTFFSLPNEIENNYYSLEWKKHKPFADIRPKDLNSNEGCVSYIVAKDTETFSILGDNSPCLQHISENMQSFNFIVDLQPELMRHFTAFYNKDGKLVFDYPRPVGLELYRVDKNNPSYAQTEKKQVKNRRK